MPRPTLPNALYITTSGTTGAANSGTPAAMRAGAWRHAGTTGANVQIQEAIDYLHGLGNGGIVCLAPGIFNISAPIKLYAGIALQGSGMVATMVKLEAGKYCDCIQHFGEYSSSGTASAGGATTLTDASKAWTVNAFAGKYVYIYGGTGAGQRRLISANTATQLTIPAWSTNPDNTSLYRIHATQQLFMRVSDMTVYGNQANNAAATGTATGGSTTTLTVAGGWTAGLWDDKAIVEITGGTNIGEVRRVLSNTATTITVDGPFTSACDNTTVFRVGGSGVAMYGHSAYDLMLTDMWTDECAMHGVFAEETWGHVYKNLISEYNGLDGLRTSLNPYLRGTTGAWPATTGVSPTEGPKMTLCKLVQNGRHGVFLGEYVYETQMGECEIAGGGTGAYGVTMATSAVGNSITGCKFVSNDGSSTGAIYLGSTGNTVTGNIIRSGASPADLTYGVRINSSYNTVVGNTISLYATGTPIPISDISGNNTIHSNHTYTTVYRDRVRGKKSLAKGTGDYITINPQLGAAGHRAGCTITVLVTPADAQTRDAGTWSVAGYPVPTASAVQVDCSGTLSAGTTLDGAVTGNASPQTIAVVSATSIKVGGMVNVAAGGGTAEDVLITAVAGNNITGTFLYSHATGTAVATLYTMMYDIGYNDRISVAA